MTHAAGPIKRRRQRKTQEPRKASRDWSRIAIRLAVMCFFLVAVTGAALAYPVFARGWGWLDVTWRHPWALLLLLLVPVVSSGPRTVGEVSWPGARGAPIRRRMLGCKAPAGRRATRPRRPSAVRPEPVPGRVCVSPPLVVSSSARDCGVGTSQEGQGACP